MGGEQGETSNTSRVIAFTLQAGPLQFVREASGQRRERPARHHGGSLEALVTPTYTFSAPKVALCLLIPSGARPKSPLLPAPRAAAGRALQPGRANPAKGSGAVGHGDGGISHGHPMPCGRRASHASDRHGLGARTAPRERSHRQRRRGRRPQPSRTSRSCPGSGGLQSLGGKRLPARETEPEMEKIRGRPPIV